MFRNIVRRIERLFQRIFRGWDDSDLWSIDYSFSKWFLKLYNKDFKFRFIFVESFKAFNLVLNESYLDYIGIDDYKRLLEEREKEIDKGINELVTNYFLWQEYGIVDWLLPRLKRFREMTNGYPTIIPISMRYKDLKLDDKKEQELTEMGFKQWKQILDKMILALELLNEEFYYCDPVKLRNVRKGLQYFRKYFRALCD